MQLGASSADTGGVAAASARPHNFTDESTHCAPGVSFVKIGITWLTSYNPELASLTAVIGGGVTVGVIVALSIWPRVSAT